MDITIFLAIVVATFASEDLTCIATGLLVQRGDVGLGTGIVACAFGIFVGDIGLWALGRGFGQAALSWKWIARRAPNRALADVRAWLDRHAAGAIVGSRFLPGTRVALYVIAGVVRLPVAVFAFWALAAAALWTPTVVLLTATLGEAFVMHAAPIAAASWGSRIGAAAAALLVLRIAPKLAARKTRVQIAARLARWSRWEFWPMALFYAPVAVWIAWLAVRHRGLSTITAANPGMPDGGLVGESKFDILQKLPPACTLPSARISPGPTDTRVSLVQALDERTFGLPLILKPDVGQRGVGVRLARTWDDVRAYFARMTAAVVVQPYHPGPYEAGVFYCRFPHCPAGHIFSITDKHFPVLIGDGHSTVEALIWTHPRYRLQGSTFVSRYANVLDRVLGPGERFPLAIAGNHVQGTMFCDGAHLRTPDLEARIDDIAAAYPGFFVGRFDIRYRDVERFKAGEDLAIVELNGVTSESTNIYDPAGTLFRAYRVLFRQWSTIFAIGAANRRAGAPVTSLRRLGELVRAHLAMRPAFPISD